MKLQLNKEIGVWVLASDELPDSNPKTVIRTIKNKNVVEHEWYFESLKYKSLSPFNYEWLKPVKEVYILTPDELEDLMEDFGRKLLNNNLIGAKQFIKNLTQ